ncbi:MAG: FAD-dependent oxidoreductase [Cryobacterium sp.]|nr:FAD-dependent oxidoreductase [Oligoflexia bacterium]
MAAVTHYLCTVLSHRSITSTVFELSFDAVPIPSLDPAKPAPTEPFYFQGGQYISIVIPGAGPNGRDLRRAYSIASAPEVRPVELCIKVVDGGPGSNYLNNLRNGDTFKGFAPYGDFTYKTSSVKNVCFIATGTGIAPFRSMMLSKEFHDVPPKSILCLLGIRDEDELLYEQELSKKLYSGESGNRFEAEWVACVSQPKGAWPGFKGRVTDYLRTLDTTYPWTDTEFYMCGAGQMIDEVRAFLTEKGVAKEAIHREIYFKQPKHSTVGN